MVNCVRWSGSSVAASFGKKRKGLIILPARRLTIPPRKNAVIRASNNNAVSARRATNRAASKILNARNPKRARCKANVRRRYGQNTLSARQRAALNLVPARKAVVRNPVVVNVRRQHAERSTAIAKAATNAIFPAPRRVRVDFVGVSVRAKAIHSFGIFNAEMSSGPP